MAVRRDLVRCGNIDDTVVCSNIRATASTHDSRAWGDRSQRVLALCRILAEYAYRPTQSTIDKPN